MAKNYIYKLYSNVNTFSQFVAGDEFSFSSENFVPDIVLEPNDTVVVYCEPGNFYILSIIAVLGQKITVVKYLDLFKDKFIDFDNGVSIKELSAEEYKVLVGDLLSDFLDIEITKDVAQHSLENVLENFVIWLNQNPKSNYFDNDFEKTKKGLEKIDEKYFEAFSYNLFNVDFNELDQFIEALNGNIWNEDSTFWTYSTSSSNHQPRAILNKDNYQRFLREFQQNKNNKIQSQNTIYYGAPGTGKSYKVDQIINELNPKFYERITFHPEFDNASFVGGYKPISEKKEDGEEVINYKFVPQAFSMIYTKAWNDLGNNYYLVIEEINRGNCAEIFGEIFQLLDRNSNYSVTPSKELKEHIIREFADDKVHDGILNGLKLPPNLHILATMNTSDQSLFPMDSAFKRRWEWEYVPICYEAKNEEGKENASFNFEIDLGDGTKYRWIDFIAKINNNHIKNNPALGMDKCIGNYFIKPTSGNTIELKPFINKVIFYLWNDVFKDEDNKVFESKGSYEDFFPIATNGLQKVKELFERIELSPIAGYPIREEDADLGQVAEENQPLA